MFHLLQWSKDQGDDDEKPAILHSFLKSSDSVLDLSSLLAILLLLLLLYYFAKPVQHHAKDLYIKVDHNTGVYDPYSLRTVCGFFNVPQY